MFSLKLAFILFLIGIIGIYLAVAGHLPGKWPTLISAGIGLGAWFILAILMFIDRTLGMIHHLKRSRQIEKEYKAERAEELQQIVQRGTSKAKKQAASKRVQLWIDTMLANRN